MSLRAPARAVSVRQLEKRARGVYTLRSTRVGSRDRQMVPKSRVRVAHRKDAQGKQARRITRSYATNATMTTVPALAGNATRGLTLFRSTRSGLATVRFYLNHAYASHTARTLRASRHANHSVVRNQRHHDNGAGFGRERSATVRLKLRRYLLPSGASSANAVFRRNLALQPQRYRTGGPSDCFFIALTRSGHA